MPAAGILTQGLTSAFQRDLYTVLNSKMQEIEQNSPALHRELTMVMQSTSYKERYDFSKFIGTENEFVDERIMQKLAVFSYELVNKKWEVTIAVLRDEIEDDQLGIIMRGAEGKMQVAIEGPERRFQTFLNHQIAGTTTTFGTGFDGKVLFSATHAWPAGYTTNQANLLTGSNAGKLDMTYGMANIEAATLALSSTFKWPDGDVIGSTPTDLICSPSVYWNATQILKSTLLVGGFTTPARGMPGSNPANILLGGLRIHMAKYMTTGYWILADLSHTPGPFIFQERSPLELSQQLYDSEGGFMRDEFRYGTRARNNFGQGVWYRAIAGDAT